MSKMYIVTHIDSSDQFNPQADTYPFYDLSNAHAFMLGIVKGYENDGVDLAKLDKWTYVDADGLFKVQLEESEVKDAA